MLNGISFRKLKISDQEKKNLLGKAESSRIVVGSSSNFGEGSRPLLIKKPLPHQLWIEIAKELIKFTEVSRGKELLEEAMNHVNILKDIEV